MKISCGLKTFINKKCDFCVEHKKPHIRLVTVDVGVIAVFTVIFCPILGDLAGSATIVDTIARLILLRSKEGGNKVDGQDCNNSNSNNFHNIYPPSRIVVSMYCINIVEHCVSKI